MAVSEEQVAFPATAVMTSYVLEAQLTDPPDSEWIPMTGFTYDTLDELQLCYDKHFADIKGRGCNYRFAKIEEAIRVTVIFP